jgi:hypothetical protein
MLLAIQPSVPAALPADPVEFVQVTSVTPTLSVASPLTVMVVAVVARMVAVGYVMSSEGGVKSPGELGGDGGDGGGAGVGVGGAGCCDCRVTMIVCVATWPIESNAVMVMVLAPRPSGTEAMVQLGELAALPM